MDLSLDNAGQPKGCLAPHLLIGAGPVVVSKLMTDQSKLQQGTIRSASMIVFSGLCLLCLPFDLLLTLPLGSRNSLDCQGFRIAARSAGAAHPPA
jgi:hypothetical protein